MLHTHFSLLSNLSYLCLNTDTYILFILQGLFADRHENDIRIASSANVKRAYHAVCSLSTDNKISRILYPKIFTRSLNSRNTISTIKNTSPMKCTMPSFSGGTGLSDAPPLCRRPHQTAHHGKQRHQYRLHQCQISFILFPPVRKLLFLHKNISLPIPPDGSSHGSHTGENYSC